MTKEIQYTEIQLLKYFKSEKTDLWYSITCASLMHWKQTISSGRPHNYRNLQKLMNINEIEKYLPLEGGMEISMMSIGGSHVLLLLLWDSCS